MLDGQRGHEARVWGGHKKLASALLLSTALTTSIIGSLQTTVPAAAQSAEARSFNIEPQPLSLALRQFADQSGMQLAYRTTELQGIESPGFRGTAPSTQALVRLLSGTGISYSVTAANTVTIARAPTTAIGATPPGTIPLEAIDVQGEGNPNSTMTPMPAYAGGQVGSGGQVGMLGNRSVMDTPFNQTSYTAQRIQDSQSRNLKDVLDDNPSVRNTNPDGSAAESFVIRGFTSSNVDVLLNGMPGLAPSNSVSSIFAERIEVLNGPGALLNGMPPSGSVGGSINMITKHAGDEPLTQLTASYSSQSQFGGQFDVSRRFGQDKACGARFNGAYSDGNTAVHDNQIRLGAAALGIDCRTDRARFSADFGYQSRETYGVNRFISIPSGLPVPPAPQADKLYGPTWLYAKPEDHFGMIRGEYDIFDNVTAYAALGGHQDNNNFLFTFPKLTDAKGNYTATVTRYKYHFDDLSSQAGVRTTVQTGWIEHSINLNGSYLDHVSYVGSTPGTSIISNLYNPSALPAQYLASPALAKTSDVELWGGGVADTMSVLDKRVQLTLGVRRQQIDAGSFAATGALSSKYSMGVWSPAFALVVKPWQNISLYANYIEGLQQGTIVGAGYANTGEVLPPYISKQYEAGVKADWGRFTTTLALFQITQPSAVVNAATNTYGVDGEQRNRGIELNIFGEVTKGVRLLGGVTFMEGVQTKTANGINDGKQATDVPHTQLNLGAEWDTPFVPDLTLNGRFIYTSSQYISTDNTTRMPGWERVDIGARYKVNLPNWKPMTVRFDIKNLFNKNYWETVGSVNYIGLGAPRTYLLSLTSDF